MMVVIVGRMVSTQGFKTDVGIGSNSHDFGEETMMIFRTSDSDADLKQLRGLPLNLVSALNTSTWVFAFKAERWSLIVVILFKKKSPKVFARSCSQLFEGNIGAFCLPISDFVSL